MRVQDISITKIENPLNQLAATRLRHALRSELLEGHVAHALDLRELSVLDSPTLAALIQALRAVREAGGSISLLVDQPQVLKILSITGLDRVFPIYPNVHSAAAALNSKNRKPA